MRQGTVAPTTGESLQREAQRTAGAWAVLQPQLQGGAWPQGKPPPASIRPDLDLPWGPRTTRPGMPQLVPAGLPSPVPQSVKRI